MLVVATGSRDIAGAAWYRRVRDRLATLPPNAVVVHGNERGADRLVDIAAAELRLQRLHAVADWDGRGKSAGPLRNELMADVALGWQARNQLVLVLAWHTDPGLGKGTRGMVNLARGYRWPVEIDLWDGKEG